MIFADKLIALRKGRGWSQEELADRMNVSRQAVSKWESAQALPDIDKIVALSALFSVSTDYLLKDDSDCAEEHSPAREESARILTLAEAEEYVAWRRTASVRIALGTLLCILSVIPLLILPITSVHTALGLAADVAGSLGFVSLFLIVAVGVVIFVHCGIKNDSYAYLNEQFSLGIGVKDALGRRLTEHRNAYTTMNVIAVLICVLSPLLIIVPALIGADEILGFTLPLTVLVIGIAVFLFIVAGVRQASLMRLLKTGEYSQAGKKHSRIKETVDSVYWSIVLAAYLGWSFLTGMWNISWVVWPVAGVLSTVVSAITDAVLNKSGADE